MWRRSVRSGCQSIRARVKRSGFFSYYWVSFWPWANHLSLLFDLCLYNMRHTFSTTTSLQAVRHVSKDMLDIYKRNIKEQFPKILGTARSRNCTAVGGSWASLLYTLPHASGPSSQHRISLWLSFLWIHANCNHNKSIFRKIPRHYLDSCKPYTMNSLLCPCLIWFVHR